MHGGIGSLRDDFAFLIGRHLDRATFDRAQALAEAWAEPVHTVLINIGWVAPEDYVRRLAQSLGVPVAVGTPFDDRIYTPVDATAVPPAGVRRAVIALLASGRRPILVTDYRIDAISTGSRQRAWLLHATDGLHRSMPIASAEGRTWMWQKIVVVLVVGTAIGLATMDTALAYFVLTWVAAIPFAFVVAQRLGVLVCAAASVRGPKPEMPTTPVSDSELPIYTVLVPLFREADVLPDLVAALYEIDYPAAKLDVLLILEEVDQETRARLAELHLPSFMRVVVVPDAQPRTKPKAMSYALKFARGRFIAVYDAEDIPDPRQLRRVMAAFRSGSEKLGCIQARHAIHNRPNTAPCSTACCRPCCALAHRPCSAAPQTISRARCSIGSPNGIRTMSPRMPISASAWPVLGSTSLCSIRRPMRRRPRALRSGCRSAPAG